MVRVAPEGLWHQPVEPVFHFTDRSARREPQPVRHTENVGIDRDGLFAECRVQDHVGSLAPDTGQRLQGLAITRHLPFMPFDQLFACLQDIRRLGVVQADGRDMALQAGQSQGAHARGVGCHRKQRLCRLVDAAVGRLCGEHDRNEQLKG